MCDLLPIIASTERRSGGGGREQLNAIRSEALGESGSGEPSNSILQFLRTATDIFYYCFSVVSNSLFIVVINVRLARSPQLMRETLSTADCSRTPAREERRQKSGWRRDVPEVLRA